jgi:hypothetical protein
MYFNVVEYNSFAFNKIKNTIARGTTYVFLMTKILAYSAEVFEKQFANFLQSLV